MSVITWKADQMWPVHNASWPKGRMSRDYDQERGVYVLKSEFDHVLGEIGSTLLSAAIVKTHNRCLDEYDASKQVHGAESEKSGGQGEE